MDQTAYGMFLALWILGAPLLYGLYSMSRSGRR